MIVFEPSTRHEVELLASEQRLKVVGGQVELMRVPCHTLHVVAARSSAADVAFGDYHFVIVFASKGDVARTDQIWRQGVRLQLDQHPMAMCVRATALCLLAQYRAGAQERKVLLCNQQDMVVVALATHSVLCRVAGGHLFDADQQRVSVVASDPGHY